MLGAGAFVASIVSFAGVAGEWIALGSAGFLALAYACGLLAHANAKAASLVFHHNGGIAGTGYLKLFRGASQSLLLMHVDDDCPGEELRGLYRSLLDRGVQLRRTILRRANHDAEGLRWLAEFGPHENLRQRIIASKAASVMPLSFAIVDESIVLVAVPGFHVTETTPYTERMIFRHLLVLRDLEVTRAFLEMYEKLWRQAELIEDEDLAPWLSRMVS